MHALGVQRAAGQGRLTRAGDADYCHHPPQRDVDIEIEWTLKNLEMTDIQARVTINGRTELIGTGGLEGAVDTDAAVYRLTPNSAWLAGAKSFTFGGQPLLAKSEAVSARIDARGLALGKAEPTPAG